MQIDPRFHQVRDFLDTLWILLGRQAVRRQIVAFILILLIAWLFSFLIGRLIRAVARKRGADEQQRDGEDNGEYSGEYSGEELQESSWRWRLYRWVRAAQYTVLPILGLVFSEVALRWFESQQWPAGLIAQLRPTFWLFLIYRIIAGVMQAVLPGRRARIYIRRFLAPLFLITVAGIIGANLSGAFGLGELQIMRVLGATITLGNLVSALVLFYFFFVFAWIARDISSLLAARRTDYEPGAIHAVTMIGYYSIIGIGALTALAIMGFDISSLAIIGGGLSVGLGFGLQELVSNFISGILLLFEQSLRVGDVISVGGKTGTVDKLHMRATVLRTLDNEEIFVPNKDLLTSTVETFTHSDRLVRRAVTVGVSYDSDPLRIRDYLLEICNRHGRILKHPAPQVLFSDFGDSSLNFELLFWLDDPPSTAIVQSDLRFMIWSEFAKYGIEIPFPQRDVHIHSVDVEEPELSA